MSILAERLTGFTDVDQEELAREFETRLVESSTLAFRVAYGVLRQREDAEDVAQEAFTKAHRSFRHLRDRTRFRAWLVRMTWRLALDRQRAERRRLARDIAHASETPADAAPQDGPAARFRAGELWRAIDALPDKYRVVVVLANMEGHGIDDVATLLGVPPGTVKSRLFHARRRLKELLR
ncbi:MAG: RNA polymerase sigma factor [Vicinamibacterales bacterium]|jgi:RNA polymerase sigma-70 factor (ECF subfamily)|nr:RNA polymerase sigma factor [Vicinamibacterales bacterium]